MGIQGLRYAGVAAGYAAGYAIDNFTFIKKGSDK